MKTLASLQRTKSARWRAQTLNVLVAVEEERKMRIVQFLAESDLVQGENPVIELRTADLIGARLVGAQGQVAAEERVTTLLDDLNLNKAQLDRANLDGVECAMPD
jgi:hypothetical protein